MLGKKDYWKVVLTFVIALGICLTALAEFDKPFPIFPTSKIDGHYTAVEKEEARNLQQIQEYKEEALLAAQYNGINGAKGTVATIMANPQAPSKVANRTTFFSEDFEDEATSTPDDPFPVAGWTRINTVTGYTWFVETPTGSSGPIGTVSALCPYGPVGSPLDEWLITPAIDVSTATSGLYVEFGYLHDNLNYPFVLDLYVSTTGTSTGDFSLLWQASGETHPNMVFTTTTVDLSAYAGESVLYLAWRYQGEDANLGGIDDIIVADALPTGRCCYGTPGDPDCIDGVTQTECVDTYSGTWAVDLNCTDDPCPIAPDNDLCTTAEYVGGTFPVTVTGNNEGATVDCPGDLDWQNGVWYSFDLPYAYNNVNLDFCGSGDWSTISAVLFTACSCDEADRIYYSSGEFYDCGDGWTVPSINFNGVEGPMTVYYCVDFEVPGDFTFEISVEELIPPENDNADKAEEIGEVTDYPFSTALATFDGPGGCQTAPNVWFCYTPTVTGLGVIELCGSGYDTKMAVYEGCETDVDGNPVGAQLACNDDDSEICTSKALQSAVQLEVVAGNTYLVEVGGYSSNVGDGDISTYVITGGVCCDPTDGSCTDVADQAECDALGGNYHGGEVCAAYTCPPPASEGDDCTDPLKVDIPGDLPYTNNGYTCGRFNNYPKEDLCYFAEFGYGYGDGEDAVYEITVSSETTIGITMDPQGTTWTYVEIRTDCPPTGTGCIYYFRNTSSGVYSSDPVTLSPGTYYIQVDTWPSPDCIPSYSLTIEDVSGSYCNASGGCDEYIENVTVGSINNTTACDEYADFTALSTDMAPGGSYPITITVGGGYSSDLGAVWIDWNQDMDFEDANEAITLDVSSGVGPYTGTINVPVDATVGPTLMRVRLAYSTMPGPCGTSSYGEVEDYTVTVLGNDPMLSLDPTSFDFGTVAEGTTGGGVLTVGNAGGGTLDFTVDIAYSKDKDLTGSSITTTDGYAAGSTMDIDFLMFNASPDVEWVAGAAITFPTGVTVNSATDFIEQADPTNYLNWQGETGDGIATTWYYDETYGIYDGEYADATVNLTFDGSLSGDLYVDYVIDGDEWGDPPHQVTGQIILSEGGGTPEWLSIDVTSGSLGGGETTPINVGFDATGLADGSYFADLVVTHNGTKAVATVPVTLIVSSATEPHMIIDPGTMHWADGNLVTDEIVTVFMGGSDMPDMNDVDQGTVLVNGLTPLGTSLGTHPDMTGDVLVIEVSKRDFVQGYGVIWTGDPYTYNCTGEYTGGGTMDETGDVTLLGHIPGDVNFDGIVNILDIMRMIDFKFKGGMAIVPIEVADVNGSGDFNILDIIYLIDYKYKGGPAPLHP